jgi:hypothetical protein
LLLGTFWGTCQELGNTLDIGNADRPAPLTSDIFLGTYMHAYSTYQATNCLSINFQSCDRSRPTKISSFVKYIHPLGEGHSEPAPTNAP